MNIIDLLFKLLRKFVPMDENEFAKLREEGVNWYGNLRGDEEAIEKAEKEGDKGLMLLKFKKMASTWQFRTGCAVAYIVLVRKIYEWIEAPLERPEEEEEGNKGLFN